MSFGRSIETESCTNRVTDVDNASMSKIVRSAAEVVDFGQISAALSAWHAGCWVNRPERGGPVGKSAQSFQASVRVSAHLFL